MVGPLLPDRKTGKTVAVYARVSSSGQSDDLDRQVSRLCAWATAQGYEVGKVVAEVGSGLNGKRRKLMRLLSDPETGTIIVEHRDRLARFGFEITESALLASGKKIVVVDDGEADDDLVRDMTEVLTSMCARLYDRQSAKNRAQRAVAAIPSYEDRPVSPVGAADKRGAASKTATSAAGGNETRKLALAGNPVRCAA